MEDGIAPKGVSGPIEDNKSTGSVEGDGAGVNAVGDGL